MSNHFLIKKSENNYWGYSLGICPTCGSSASFPQSFVTMMQFFPFRDMSGREHDHDMNKRTMSGKCSGCGYEWNETYYAGSCSCGWPYDGQYTPEQPHNLGETYGPWIMKDGQLMTNPLWTDSPSKPVEFVEEIGMAVGNIRSIAKAIL